MAFSTEKNTGNIKSIAIMKIVSRHYRGGIMDVYVNACICTCLYAYSADKWKELYIFLFIYWVLKIFKKC